MRVAEVMSAPVVTVGPETPLRSVAARLVEHGISGMPVLAADGTVLGVVSEADILLRGRAAGPARSHLLAAHSDAEGAWLEAKLDARTAGEAMTSPAITVRADAPLAQAAALLVDRDVNRLPVVDGRQRLVGIVTRADLVRAFARSDAELAREIREEVVPGCFLWCSPGHVGVDVTDGQVTFAGEVECEDVARLLVANAERVPGVLSVRSSLSWPADSPRRPLAVAGERARAPRGDERRGSAS